jgi:phenolic acid decarboxylase
MTHELIGKTFQYDYGKGGAYEVHFASSTAMTWRRVKGQGVGEGAIETYQIQRVGQNIYFINWIERDGLCVSQVLDLNANKITVSLFRDHEMNAITGSVSSVTALPDAL